MSEGDLPEFNHYTITINWQVSLWKICHKWSNNCVIRVSNLLTMSVPFEGYNRNLP
jgi:hypothetical protein